MQELRKVSISSSEQGDHDLILGYAQNEEDVEAAQKLRYEVYAKELNVRLPHAADGIDCDAFDPWCQHLIVKESLHNRVVGTYRILSPQQAQRSGQYYSSTEFDISELNPILGQLAECGRSCIHQDYRDGTAIMLLLNGLARFLRDSEARYLFGCASVSLVDGGHQAAQVYHKYLQKDQAGLPHVYPHQPYPVDQLPSVEPSNRLPPLIKGYLNLGARICGEPAWDKDFNSADFPIIIDFHGIKKSYLRHWGII